MLIHDTDIDFAGCEHWSSFHKRYLAANLDPDVFDNEPEMSLFSACTNMYSEGVIAKASQLRDCNRSVAYGSQY